MNITFEMADAKEELSMFLSKQPKRAPSVNSYEFSEHAMNEEFKSNPAMKSDGLRDFYSNTKNADTAHAFMGQHAMESTGVYRSHFKNSNDPLAQDQLRIADDCSYRAMFQVHAQEKLKAEPEQKKLLDSKHALESSYFHFREAHGSHSSDANQRESLAEKVTQAYTNYKAEKLGYNTVDERFKNDAQAQKEVGPPKKDAVQMPSPATVQERMLAMRAKSLSRGQARGI